LKSGGQFRDMRKCPSPFSLHEVFHFHGSRAMVLQPICFVAGRFHDMRSPTGDDCGWGGPPPSSSSSEMVVWVGDDEKMKFSQLQDS